MDSGSGIHITIGLWNQPLDCSESYKNEQPGWGETGYLAQGVIPGRQMILDGQAAFANGHKLCAACRAIRGFART
jgi:hypothetical protein